MTNRIRIGITKFPLILILAVVSLSIAKTCVAENELRMGYFDIPPHVINSDTEVPDGAAISYFNEYIAPHLGVAIMWDVKVNPPTRLMDQLRIGEKDGMIFLGKTEERTKYYHYPDPYLTIPETLAFLKDKSPGKIDDVTDLYGLTIGFLVGGRIPDALDDENIKYDLIAGKRLFERNVEKLLAGRIDAIYAPLSTALANIIDQKGVSDKIELIPMEFLDPVNIYTVFSKQTVKEQIINNYNNALSAALDEIEYLDYMEKYTSGRSN